MAQDVMSERPDEIARTAADLIACSSIEMSAHRPDDARAIAALLPTATAVYVNHLPRYTLDHTLESLIAVHEVGLEAVPHLAARRIGSRAEARAFLDRAVRLAGVRKVLLIGGDIDDPAGPYKSGAEVLADHLLRECGVHEVVLPGYPEG